ncbi:unnamed protein product [Gadus morhua 'NCC']
MNPPLCWCSVPCQASPCLGRGWSHMAAATEEGFRVLGCAEGLRKRLECQILCWSLVNQTNTRSSTSSRAAA